MKWTVMLALAVSTVPAAERVFPLADAKGLELAGVVANPATYQGKSALRLIEDPVSGGGPVRVAIVKGLEFRDGTIEVDVAGAPAKGSLETARGFVGVAFRVRDDKTYECFYIRPTNGRADDQLRRNHSTQYTSQPVWPWQRLRQENPGVYESYVDLVPGEWTHLRITVEGKKARLYVNGSSQPVLIVNDLKLGDGAGGVALWVGDGSETHFRQLRVYP